MIEPRAQRLVRGIASRALLGAEGCFFSGRTTMA
jgi:hypothetical protein